VKFSYFSLDFGPNKKSFGVRFFFVPQNVYAIVVNIENFKKIFLQKCLRKIEIDDLNTFQKEILCFEEVYIKAVRNYHFWKNRNVRSYTGLYLIKIDTN
jgi:hypothetical protein